MHQLAFTCRAAVVIFAVAIGLSAAGGPSNLAAALGAAGGLFPLVLTTETTTWKQCSVVLAYHGSVWLLFVFEGDPGAILGVAIALFVAAVVATRQTFLSPADRPFVREYVPLVAMWK